MDHMARVHQVWRPTLLWMAKTEDPLTRNKTMGPFNESAGDLSLKLEQTIIDWMPETLYKKRVQLAGGPGARRGPPVSPTGSEATPTTSLADSLANGSFAAAHIGSGSGKHSAGKGAKSGWSALSRSSAPPCLDAGRPEWRRERRRPCADTPCAL